MKESTGLIRLKALTKIRAHARNFMIMTATHCFASARVSAFSFLLISLMRFTASSSAHFCTLALLMGALMGFHLALLMGYWGSTWRSQPCSCHAGHARCQLARAQRSTFRCTLLGGRTRTCTSPSHFDPASIEKAAAKRCVAGGVKGRKRLKSRPRQRGCVAIVVSFEHFSDGRGAQADGAGCDAPVLGPHQDGHEGRHRLGAFPAYLK